MAEITGWGDSDWAGDRKTRKSTSGGAIMIGHHLLHHYSSTQSNIALSSGEAELNSNVKISVESIAVKNMAKDIGMDLDVITCTDSSAAKGIQTRRGCGKVKHLEAKQLWCQHKVAQGEVKVKKVPRKDNPSDNFTHHWIGSDEQHFLRMGLWRC